MKNTLPVRKPYQALAWFGTIALIVGATMTALNIYPLNVYVCVLANGLWLWCGWLWREPSVIGLNFAMTIIYVAGTINVFLK
tara:strand:- start:3115 stop:3360 length:246 start_codon:yes stop_codon:yes gene_type:complete